MTARPLVLLAAVTALAGCRQILTIPPTDSPVSQEELVVTGLSFVDARGSWPIAQEQIYPQVRVRAFEAALEDAQGQMLARMGERPVYGGRRLGDVMDRHESVELLTRDFVEALPNDAPRWNWERGEVEVDLRVTVGQIERFVGSLPLAYLEGTEPRDQRPPDFSPMLPPPQPLTYVPPPRAE